jgi:hypothetical protein
VLVFDGVMPYVDVIDEFAASAPGLPPATAAFIADKMREYARPARVFRRRGAKTPRWLERMREREKTAARLRFLDSQDSSG